jgi:lysophospholipase L1-like esterase
MKRAGIASTWLLLIASSALCLGVLELSLRVFLPARPLDGEDPPARFHTLRYAESPVSRHVLAAAPLDVDLADGRHYHINSKGYRGDEFSWSKTPGELRIVVYGGSAAFDIYQGEGRDWPARVERYLVERGIPAEVINAGIPGHASFDSVGRLLAEGHRLDPDFVLFYHAWNDLKYFRDPSPVLRQVRPLRQADSIWRPQGRLDGALCARSHLYRHLRLGFLQWNRELGDEGRLPPRAISDAFAQEQVGQFRLAMATFIDLVRNVGAVPVLVAQPLLVASDNGDEERSMIGYGYVGLTEKALVEAYAAANGAVHDVAREKHAALIDAAAEMSGRSDYFRDGVHLSDDGSRALATLVGRQLEEMIEASKAVAMGRRSSP